MIEVRALAASDDRSRFRSGHPDLDRFFVLFAGQNQFRHHLGVTYVAVEEEQILGFVTVSSAQVEAEVVAARVRKTLPRYPLPALRLARLAVAAEARGRGVGQLLVRFVLDLALEMAGRIGCVGVIVDAKPDAVGFHERLGFESLSVVTGELCDRPLPRMLFLELGAIRRP